VEVLFSRSGPLPGTPFPLDKKNVTWPAPARQIAVNSAASQLKALFLGRLQPHDAFRDQTVITNSVPIEPPCQPCHRAHSGPTASCRDRPTTLGPYEPGNAWRPPGLSRSAGADVAYWRRVSERDPAGPVFPVASMTSMDLG
jgi:hypothetical protein